MSPVSGETDDPEHERPPSRTDDQWHGYEIRGVVDGQVQLWAVTRNRNPSLTDRDAAEWADWNAAAFTPLEQVDAQLAEELAGVLIDEFLRHGGLSAHRKDEALAGLRLRRGLTPRGTLILGADLPLGAGHPESVGWLACWGVADRQGHR
jgi:hypothetical protein